MNQYLKFYNKAGEFCNNFVYDPVSDSWSGRIDFFKMSEGLIENYQIYVLESVYNTTSETIENSIPIVDEWVVQLQKIPTVPEFFIYDISSSILNKYKTYSVHGSVQSQGDPLDDGMKTVGYTLLSAIQINLGFQPSIESGFETTLTITNGDSLVAKFTLYGEGESEDERLSDLLTTIGYDILPSDSKIFSETDIKEENSNWVFLNRKRKELLLEYQNIFPYIGSYKALINVLKFYGYQNVKMKEYWKNVDVNSVNFGKTRQVDIGDIFSTHPNPAVSDLIPSKVYRKLNLFSLVYEINVEIGQYDNEGIPITVDALQFTQEEVLIKLFALRNKLREYYLPVNAKIIDIIGEAIYFASYKINQINSLNRIDSISLGVTPSYTIIPSSDYYIQDLRPLQFLGSPIGPDMNAGGVSNVLVWQPVINKGITAYNIINANADIYFVVSGMTAGVTNWRWNPDHGSFFYTQQEVMNALVDSINKPVYVYGINNQSDLDTISSNFYAYSEYPNNTIRIVEKIPGKYSISDTIHLVCSPHYGFDPSNLPTSNTVSGKNISPGNTFGPNGAPLSFFGSAYLGSFDPMNLPIQNLNDDIGIPVGCPITLINNSFDYTWDAMNVIYNSIDAVGPSGSSLYGDFTTSFEIVGWTSISGTISPITIGVTGFPNDSFPTQYNYTWDNIGQQGFTEMQWIVTKTPDDGPDFIYDSGQLPIKSINQIGLVLPYVGTYHIRLNIWDSYNSRSFVISEKAIEVKMLDPDFIGWYTHRELDYTWNDSYFDNDSTQSNNAIIPNRIGSPKRPITWDDYGSTWDLPIHPNESMDMLEMTYDSINSTKFYNTITNPIDNLLVDRDAYKFNLLGSQATFDDAYHLWSDVCGTRLTEFNLEFPVGATSHLVISRSNCNIPMDGSINIWYLKGPTGFTGATGNLSYTPGSITGDILYIASNRFVYINDGTEWKYQDNTSYDSICVHEIPSFDGNTPQLANNLNSYSSDYVFGDFIYYSSVAYNPENTGYSFSIQAVSKDFDRTGKYKLYSSSNQSSSVIRINSNAGSTFSTGIAYETTNLGYIGDIPTSFEIYAVSHVGPIGSFTIKYNTESVTGSTSFTYNIGSTSLPNLCFELNGPTAQSLPIIGDFTYNMVYGATGWFNGNPGPTSFSNIKIQAISKSFTYPQSIGITYSNGMLGSLYGRSIIKNPTWNSIRVLKYSQTLPILTTVNFTYDNSKVPGKVNPTWILHREDDPNFSDIYYNNQYFSYMFNQKGSYTITLKIEDTNGNSNSITKKEIIKII
jgi:hypothetical protein